MIRLKDLKALIASREIIDKIINAGAVGTGASGLGAVLLLFFILTPFYAFRFLAPLEIVFFSVCMVLNLIITIKSIFKEKLIPACISVLSYVVLGILFFIYCLIHANDQNFRCFIPILIYGLLTCIAVIVDCHESKVSEKIINAVGAITIVILCVFACIKTFAKEVYSNDDIRNSRYYSNAIELINSNKYNEAIKILENMTYKDSKKQLSIAQAGIVLSNKDYDSGIKKICDVGGSVMVKYDANGGTTPVSEETINSYKTISNKASKEYYKFTNWDMKFFSITTRENSYVCNVNLLAKYETINYAINYKMNDGINDISNPNYYSIDTGNISLADPSRVGYTFDGWYYNNRKINKVDISYKTNIEIEARWNINNYKIVINNPLGLSVTGFVSGNYTDYNSTITLTVNNVENGYVGKWSRSDSEYYLGNEYTFKMPNHDINIEISKVEFERNDNKIYFGYYPQSKVIDETLISSLNTMAGTSGWIDYNYYVSGETKSFMFYKDIDYDNNGTFDYRGVYFTQYRPQDEASSSYYHIDNGYETNIQYWFAYERIEWDILSNENGRTLLVTNKILDSQDFYPSATRLSFDHNGGNGYVNNYELSNIRKWLNEDFYNLAFNNYPNTLDECLVDNSLSTTNNTTEDFICNDTNDKLFLLSYRDVVDNYKSNNLRTALVSDYALCQGVWAEGGKGYWGLRSPGSALSKYDSYKDQKYYIYDVKIDGSISSRSAYSVYVGVRPACYIFLE